MCVRVSVCALTSSSPASAAAAADASSRSVSHFTPCPPCSPAGDRPSVRVSVADWLRHATVPVLMPAGRGCSVSRSVLQGYPRPPPMATPRTAFRNTRTHRHAHHTESSLPHTRRVTGVHILQGDCSRPLTGAEGTSVNQGCSGGTTGRTLGSCCCVTAVGGKDCEQPHTGAQQYVIVTYTSVHTRAAATRGNQDDAAYVNEFER